jgi:prepilin-type N-terminal cleavage/methylation domain-containing protein/prepilin-type processing-associated H-X9-DG protein
MKKAFTLIELLVVIAIIAILAAILFPVFAQAKVAAKGAASISNAKQESLGILMYSGDNDDVFPLATAWNTGSDPLTFGAGLAFSTWGYLVNPYVKSGEILQDPLVGGTPTFFNSRVLTLTSYPGYGYNYVYLSRYEGTPARMIPSSGTAAANPAQTVMLANRGSYSDGDGFFWAFDFTPWTTTSPMLNTTIEVPHCYSIPQWCADNWGEGGWGSGVNENNLIGGWGTGGVTKRVNDGAVISWVDGHVSKAKINALAAGTNYSPTTPAPDTVFTDITKYVWDLE